MWFIYVIGAQCTGKTTLVEAIGVWLRQNKPHMSILTIHETARTVLQTHQFSRDDVRAGGERCLQLQKLILQRQIESERGCKEVDIVISDRSGIDPLVYGQMYCGADSMQEMVQCEGWKELKTSMGEGTVVVCEPVESWLFDDGVRLLSESMEEWMATHGLFCETLSQNHIPYVVLPASKTRVDERVNFVLEAARIASGEE